MKRLFRNFLAFSVAAFSLVACNNAAKMAELAEQVKITCDPEVLEVVAGNIDADVTVNFPADYFLPKARLTVIPVLKYMGGEVQGTPFEYQGQKVTENYKMVSKNGAAIREHVNFKYAEGMEKSELVARAKVLYKGREYEYPGEIKIADGANTTYMLVNEDGTYHLMADNYQEVIPEEVEAQILYLINSATVRPNQLTTADMKDYKAAVSDAMKDERRTIVGTDIVAYASPDGPVARNNTLSEQRENSAEQAFKTVAKNLETGAVSTRSIGEDWEGFQELVNASNIEDKDLILRVLSMYSDPNVREREIKNMSSVYKSLADNILPELRRARFITNVEFQNYTPEELTALVSNNIDVLDEEALLRVATLVDNPTSKQAIYRQAVQKFDSDRARFNSAVTYLDAGDLSAAKTALAAVKSTEGCVTNLKGVIAMREKNYTEAARLFASTECPNAKQNSAVIDILNGSYAQAAQKLAGTGNPNEGLAYILSNQLDKAANVLKGTDPVSAYERAIIAARRGNSNAAQSEIRAASADSKLANRAATDVEFAKIQ
ncbi:MAG: hypothetical protein IKX60_04985 [Bacteroidales bacterium]|nr:hypothetical protein [Bacteroidales bacterium]